jgi:hypothetical protein
MRCVDALLRGRGGGRMPAVPTSVAWASLEASRDGRSTGLRRADPEEIPVFLLDTGTVVYSASDLTTAAACEWAFMRRLDAKLGRIDATPEAEDAMLARTAPLSWATRTNGGCWSGFGPPGRLSRSNARPSARSSPP